MGKSRSVGVMVFYPTFVDVLGVWGMKTGPLELRTDVSSEKQRISRLGGG